MAAYPSIKLLSVFLASPGDLAEERKIAADVVSAVNRSAAAELGWRVDLLGWEDTLPGSRRPQELINEEVDRCELFIGLLWQRWGQPTGADSYTSGFEEEFTRAERRCDDTQSPQIWLFFRQIDRERLEDPGEQLAKVVEFRRSQISAKKHLFKEFTDSRDWERKFFEYLTKYLVKLSKASERPSPESEGRSAPPTTSRHRVSDIEISSVATSESGESEQAAMVVHSVAQAITKGALGTSARPRDLVDPLIAGRLNLIATAFSSDTFGHEPPGMHELNKVYLHRSHVVLAPGEKKAIFRTILDGNAIATPGWYWFKDVAKDRLDAALLVVAATDENEPVRLAVIQMYSNIMGSDRPDNFAKYLGTLLNDSSGHVRAAAMRLVFKADAASDFDLERQAETDAENLDLLRGGLRAAQLRKDPTGAFSSMIEEISAPHEILRRELERQIAKVDTGVLVRATNHRSTWLRWLAVGELARRETLDTPTAERLLTDTNPEIRMTGFRNLMDQGRRFTTQELRDSFKRSQGGLMGLGTPSVDSNALILEQLSCLDKRDLEDHIDWYNVDGPLAYKALAVNFSQGNAVRIRNDLETEFRNVKADSEKRIREQYGELGVKKLTEGFDQFQDYIADAFSAAALSGLAKHGVSQDVRFGRKFLREAQDLRLLGEAVEVVARFGDQRDVADLLRVANAQHGVVRRRALETAMKLSPGRDGAVRELLAAEDPDFIRIALQNLDEGASVEIQSEIYQLLFHKNDEIRELALAKLTLRSGDRENENLLEQYLGSGVYYYNVVCWLDRIIYAPESLKQFFQSQMEEKLRQIPEEIHRPGSWFV